MKNLLNKTLHSFTLYSLVVLAASIPAYYILVDGIWLKELDEHNIIIADRTVNELEKLKLSDSILSESITLWNKLQPGTDLKRASSSESKPDSIYVVMRLNKYRKDNEIDRFRGLERYFKLNGEVYQLNVETNVEETEETALAIALTTIIFFLVLVVGFLFLNKRLSATVWQPFRKTLGKLKAFNLNSQQKIEFDRSDTIEFEELNTVLEKLIEHNISVFRIQKEFTENASHELQTPLAIVKSKLDLLLQTETLSERQYDLIEQINKALTRTSRINKNLLMLAKIENQQFEDKEFIDLTSIARQYVQEFREHTDLKSIAVNTNIADNVIVKGNKDLAEILINNLFLNAIRHSENGAVIEISLNQQALCVANSGSESLQTENVFKRFSRTSASSHGTGLGLSIVSEICNSHRWSIAYKFTGSYHQFEVKF